MEEKRENLYGEIMLITGYEKRQSKFDENKSYSIVNALVGPEEREVSFIANDYMTRQLEEFEKNIDFPFFVKLENTKKGPRFIPLPSW